MISKPALFDWLEIVCTTRCILLGISLLFLPIISHAQTSNTLVLPGLANVSGANGTKFESTVWLTHLGSAASTVELGFIPFSGAAAPPVQIRPISRGETLRFNNVLRELFGLEETAGALTARSNQPFDLRGVTANVIDPTGTFGLSIQSVAATALIRGGQSGHSIWLSHGTDLSRGFRTNVTVVLTEPNSSVTVSLYDEVNTLRGVEIVSSPAPMTWQASSSQLLSNPELRIGRVKFAVTAGAATAYTSVVDNITGDGIVVQPERPGSGTTDLLLNGVVRTPGANNTFFATDIRLFNPNESQLTVTIDALSFAGGTRTLSRTLAAGGLAEILDVLGPNGFNFPEGSAGALRFRAASPFLVAGRTNNVDPTGRPGSFSTFQKAVAFGSGFITPSNRGTLIGLNQNAGVPGFRSNVAFFGGPDGAAGMLRLCDQLGLELARVPFTLDSQQWQQQRITGWFEGVEIPRDARVDVQLSRGSLDGYAAVVDNKTGDGVIVSLIPTQNIASGAQITSLSTSGGQAGQTITNFTVIGSGLGNATGIRFSPSDGVTTANVRVTETSVTADLQIASNASPGNRLVSLMTPAGDSNTLAFSVSQAAAATKLAFAAVPASATAGSPFALVVQALQADGSVDPNFAGAIAIAIASGSGSLGGTLNKAAVAGAATFDNLTLSAAGSYTLRASSGSLSGAVTGAITVAAADPTVLQVGTFKGENGYTTRGTLQVLQNADDSQTLKLNSDFSTSSGGGTIGIYLANSTGSINLSQSVRLGLLTNRFSGEFTFALPASGTAGYSHVVAHCEPFRVVFGSAQLRNP